MLNGSVAMAVPAAEAGSAAIMEAKPEAKVNENGGAAPAGTENNTAETPQTSTDEKSEDTKNEASTGEMTGSTTGNSSSATPENSGNTEGAETAGTNGSVNETTDTDAGMTGTDTDMAGGDTANMAGDGMAGMDGMNTEVGTARPITQNAPVMIGITAGVLALSILVGIGLAKLKIKKGINLYED